MVDNETLYRTILDAIPQPVLLVDDDVNVIDLNRAALELVNKSRLEVLYIRGGEMLNCIHTNDSPGGCGRGPHCGDCIIRNSVTASLSGKPVHRQRTKAELVQGDEVKEIELMVTASPVWIGNRKLALLILEDITEIVRLRTLVPMCSKCRRVRNDEQFWQSVEAYIKAEFNAEVTHSLCQECVTELYPEHSEAILRNVSNRANGKNHS
ncbi:PAS domain-containing protein [Sphingobacteriales bacterium CHB3]|nr:PAS domain-containing protein [Sphingobacteriales bacterium CHB3]